ncbi:MAG: hypothetical protein JHC79_04775 [Williamsia sp.]|nr:hypothetical protein [Williamsia sp.]
MVDDVYRVTGNDESYLLAQKLFGMSAPIQYCWILPEDPGETALFDLNDQLAQGILARRVADPRVPFARARWVRCDTAPRPRLETAPVDDSSTSDWFDDRVRSTRLDPVSGYGWQLDAAPTSAGRYAVSLLVSHMTSDGQGIYRALAAAHAHSSRNPLPPASAATGMTGLRADLTDAGGQIAAAARSLRVLAGAALAARRGAGAPSSAAPEQVEGPPAVASRVPADDPAPEPTLAIYDLDRGEWAARAAEFGGTTNSLFTGVIGGLVQRAGVRSADGVMRVCIAVSKREGDDDDRANASGGVWIRVPGAIGPDVGLGGIRALSKQAFVDYATSGDRQVADNVQPIVRLLPSVIIGRLMAKLAGPDTTVSNLGEAPATALEIGGVTAESFVIRALMQGQPAQVRREKGPALAAWAVEYADKVSVAFFGIDPDHFGDPDALHRDIRAELDRWGLSHSAW